MALSSKSPRAWEGLRGGSRPISVSPGNVSAQPWLSLTEPPDILESCAFRERSSEAPAMPFTDAACASQAPRFYGTTSTILRVVGSTSTGVSSTTVY